MLLMALSTAQSMAGEVRHPVVAGLFYPGSAEDLKKSVQVLMEQAGGTDIPGKIRALIAPHAGYVYSGIVAAAGYRQIDPDVNKVILLGSSHQVPLERPSIPNVSAYETPLGKVPLASLAARLRNHPDFLSVSQAHEKEHSLEVQLPFLQVALKELEIVPILTNKTDPERLASLLESLIDEHTLIVASSDLSHYYSYDTAVSLDRICITAVVEGSVADMALCQACGKNAVLTVMQIAEKKGWRAELVEYKNSGDTSGSKDRVVGYATIAFTDGKETIKKMNQGLSDEGKKELLRFARTVMKAGLIPDTPIQRPTTSCPALFETRGCFVTLHKKGRLRGCIGSIQPVSDLITCVEENAQNAAFRDPRFPPLTKEELSEIDIEISVLTVPKKVHFSDAESLKRQLEPLKHGVILSRGTHKSTFLPQVWKQLPDKEAFLEHLCLKGSMPAQAWQDPKTEVKTYRAEVYGEKDY